VFEQELPGTTVINLGTVASLSSVDTLEVHARTLFGLGDRYKCIAIGLHPFFLRKFDRASYELVTTDYVATLSLRGVFDLSRKVWELSDTQKKQIAYKYLLPLGQQSLILNRLIRLSLYEKHRTWINPSTPPRDFEQMEGEFVPQLGSPYAGKPSVLKDVEESYPGRIREFGWDRADMFGGSLEASALHHVLKLLSAITDRLIVVELPESHLFRGADLIARPPYEAALSSSNVTMEVLRCGIPRDEEYDNFYDPIHLNERGSERISRSIAHILTTGQQGTDGLCQMRSKTSGTDAN
jgi:hypothetical protein